MTGKEIFELAGYTVKQNGPTFQLWDDDKCLFGFSNSDRLLNNPKLAMEQIKDMSFKNGHKKGVKHAQEQIKIALGIK